METVSKAQKDKLTEVLNNLESFLANSKWFAGDEMTIADLSILPSVTTVKVSNSFLGLRQYSDQIYLGTRLWLAAISEIKRVAFEMSNIARIWWKFKWSEIFGSNDFVEDWRKILSLSFFVIYEL